MQYSLSLIPALAAVALGQVAIPDSTSALVPSALPGCGGCFIVANVQQVIFADYTITQTATVVAGVGRNGTVVMSTAFTEAPQAFSYGTAGVIDGAPVTGAYIPFSGSTISLNGGVYTSPTAYNAIGGFTEFGLTQSGGSCVTYQIGATSLQQPFQYPLTAGAGSGAILSAENAFSASYKLTCAPSGAVVTSIIPVPAVSTTTTSTTSSIFRPTPQAASQTAAAASAGSSAAATTDSGINVSLGPGPMGSASTSTSPSQSYATGAASSVRGQFTSFTVSTGLVVALMAVPGLAALFL